MIQGSMLAIRNKILMVHLWNILESCDPKTYVDISNEPKWEIKINKEYNSLLKNNTWELFFYIPKDINW